MDELNMAKISSIFAATSMLGLILFIKQGTSLNSTASSAQPLDRNSYHDNSCVMSGPLKLCPDWLFSFSEHEPMTLTCLVTPEQSDVRWFKDGVPLHGDDHISISPTHGMSSLRIIDTQVEDSGNFTCKASALGHDVYFSGYVTINGHITVTHPRVVDTQPESLEQPVTMGTDVNISCTFDVGSSAAELNIMQWKKNGTELEDNYKTEYNVQQLGAELMYTLLIRNMSTEDLGHYQCYGQNHFGNDSQTISLVRQIDPDKHQANNLSTRWIIILGGAGGVTLVVMVIIGALLLRRKKEGIEWEKPDLEHFEVPEHPLTSDVFISYSSEDQQWVKDILYQRLTNSGYEVNIDFKDFVPGMAIAENIMDSIYKSRKTVVVMSKNFLKSMWAQFELQQAHNRAIAQRKDVLILIKFGKCKVPGKLMGKTFLDFTDADIKPHFWQRFYDAIGKPGLDLQKEDQEKLVVENEEDMKEKENIKEKNNKDKKCDENDNDDDSLIDISELPNKIFDSSCSSGKDSGFGHSTEEEVCIRVKGNDRTQRLTSTESCESQDSCVGRRISLEETRPLL